MAPWVVIVAGFERRGDVLFRFAAFSYCLLCIFTPQRPILQMLKLGLLLQQQILHILMYVVTSSYALTALASVRAGVLGGTYES